MILSGTAVQLNGCDCRLCCSRKRAGDGSKDAALQSAFCEGCGGALDGLSHEADVGVKWNVHRGWQSSHWRTLDAYERVVVEDGVDRLSRRDLLLDGVQKAMNS